MKKISILGSTGSIGIQALDVVGTHRDRFKIVGLSASGNIDELEKQIEEFNPEVVAVFEKEKAEILSHRVGKRVKIVSGMEGLTTVATLENADIVLTSVVGSVGLIPTLEAIRRKKTIALANKETLVAAGELVMKEAKKHAAGIVPVDSEHSAIFQCLQGEDIKNVSRIILTASGGSFRDIVGPKVGSELRVQGLTSLILAVIGILIYVAFRFEWRFAVASVLALVHDVIIAMGALSLEIGRASCRERV